MNPYLGEIFLFGGNFAPYGSVLCNGQLLPISGNEPLYQLIGTVYGGDGVNTFAVPDLQGRTPISQGSGNGLSPRQLGQISGAESTTLTMNEMAAHSHRLTGTSVVGAKRAPAGAVFAADASTAVNFYAPATSTVSLDPRTVSLSNTGGQPFDQMQPYLALTFCISTVGIFPSQN